VAVAALRSLIWLLSTFFNRPIPADGSQIDFKTSLRETGALIDVIIGGGGGGGPNRPPGGGGGGGGGGPGIYITHNKKIQNSFLFFYIIL
jgi:hypothetical protein